MTVTDVLKELGIPYEPGGGHKNVRPGFVGIDCPFCSPGWGKFLLGINERRLYCSCWKCGTHSLYSTLQASSQVSGRRLALLLRGVAPGVDFARPRGPGKLRLPSGIGPLLPAHRRYLEGRGLDPDYCEGAWGVRGIGIASKLSWRLFIPVTLEGRVISWTTRSISDDVRLRYRSASKQDEEVSAKTVLYGEEKCGHAVVVVEGPLDAWAVGDGAVATLGVGYSRQQAYRLVRFPVRVIAFDNEEGAQRRARELCEFLAQHGGKTYNVVLSGKDASRSPRQEVLNLRRRFLDG